MQKISEELKTRMAANQGISSDDINELIASHADEDQNGGNSTNENIINESSFVKSEPPEDNDTAIKTSVAELDSKNFFLGMLGAAKTSGNIEITPEDKSRFIESVLSGSRMKASYSLFGGRFNFVVKTRTYEEARAAMTVAYKQSSISDSQTLFSLKLRLMLMCMQIDEFNGASFPDADTLGNLLPIYENGKLVNPKWMDRIQIFDKLPEAVFEAVWQCVYEFETKYWSLIRHSRDQDFWRPE